ncbi:hypothetical protein GCM10023093_31390 [Nemorincola caseinilytica]|uniref:Polymerase nucleotidyl transferase domain-containing protein n=1 Tax=Nemorincola caseinilytica TaxID=2054315 RepID=A0ABP8NRX7_9BACT
MPDTDQILQQIKRSVLATDPYATLILYGSYARGDHNADSDIDILVLLDKDKITFEDRKRIGYPLYHIQVERDILISPFLCPRKKWEAERSVTPFYKNVAKDGIVL